MRDEDEPADVKRIPAIEAAMQRARELELRRQQRPEQRMVETASAKTQPVPQGKKVVGNYIVNYSDEEEEEGKDGKLNSKNGTAGGKTQGGKGGGGSSKGKSRGGKKKKN